MIYNKINLTINNLKFVCLLGIFLLDVLGYVVNKNLIFINTLKDTNNIGITNLFCHYNKSTFIIKELFRQIKKRGYGINLPISKKDNNKKDVEKFLIRITNNYTTGLSYVIRDSFFVLRVFPIFHIISPDPPLINNFIIHRFLFWEIFLITICLLFFFFLKPRSSVSLDIIKY